jgi:hypothetical protein
MQLRKSLGLKISALIASLGTLGGVWAMVHTNPPARAADPAGTSATPAATTGQPGKSPTPVTGRARTQTSAPQARKHTRTRVS